MNVISTKEAPPPAGHYEQARVHDGVVHVAGQLPIDPANGKHKLDTIEEQTQQALENVAAVLRAAGSDLDRVVKTTVYVADIELWDRVNEVYASFFGDYQPARAVVPIRELHHGFQVEIEVVGVVRGSRNWAGRWSGAREPHGLIPFVPSHAPVPHQTFRTCFASRCSAETQWATLQNGAQTSPVAALPGECRNRFALGPQ